MTDDTRELIASALSGDLTPAQSDALLAACHADPQTRAELGRLTVADRLLRAAHSEADATLAAAEVVARLRAVPHESEHAINRLSRWAWWTLFGPRVAWAMALLLLLAAASVILFQFRPAARLVRTEAAVWNGAARANGDLRAGQRLTLTAGLAQVEFENGAVVVLEGPADFEIRNRSSSYLHHGRAVARVPEQARGFVIDSPRGKLVDLGTEFGISVEDGGETEVHVLEGRVEATLSGRTQPLELRASEGMRLVSGGSSWLKADEAAFVTEMPPLPEYTPGFVHWSFDEGSGTVSHNSGRGLAEEDAHLELRTLDPARSNGPAWIAGPFGPALEFDGRGAFAECRYRGVSGRQARTIAAWVRVPTDFQTVEGYGIVGWGVTSSSGRAWQLSANPVAEEGDLGRLRIGAGNGAVVGSTDLRDGRWHHVAAVMYGGAKANTATHVLLYVDGQLDPASRKSLREIITDTESPDHGLWIGRNIGSHGNPPADTLLPGGPFFRGAVDEIFIVSAALSQEQIQRLMRENRL